MVLYEMGQVDKSLQVFLQCLALDESFPCAKRQMEKVRQLGLCDALSAVVQRQTSTLDNRYVISVCRALTHTVSLLALLAVCHVSDCDCNVLTGRTHC